MQSIFQQNTCVQSQSTNRLVGRSSFLDRIGSLGFGVWYCGSFQFPFQLFTAVLMICQDYILPHCLVVTLCTLQGCDQLQETVDYWGAVGHADPGWGAGIQQLLLLVNCNLENVPCCFHLLHHSEKDRQQGRGREQSLKKSKKGCNVYVAPYCDRMWHVSCNIFGFLKDL